MIDETIVSCVFILISLLTFFFAGYYTIPKPIRKPMSDEVMYVVIHVTSILVVISLAAWLIYKGKLPSLVTTLCVVGLGIIIVPLTTQKTWTRTES